MLLFLLGLREQHKLLDFGCGSLRSGRLLIPYLQAGHYFGIDPNQWLIDAEIEQEIGRSILDLKQPRFDNNADCQLSVFNTRFDFIHAHSILTHAPKTMLHQFFSEAAKVLENNGLILATFTKGKTDYAGEDWLYPQQTFYTQATFQSVLEQHGLSYEFLRIKHTEQTYFIAAKDPAYLNAQLESVKQEYDFNLV